MSPGGVTSSTMAWPSSAGLPSSAATRSSAAIPALMPSRPDQPARRPFCRASENAARAYGRARVSALLISDLGCQLVEDVLKRPGVDLATDQAFGAGHGQRTDLLAQILARAVGGGLDLGHGDGLLAIRLGQRVLLGLLDDLAAATVRLLDDLVGLAARFAHDLVDLVLRLRQILLAAISGGEAFSDLLLALLDGLHQRRPDELDGDPDEDRERDHLTQQGDIDVHVVPCTFPKLPGRRRGDMAPRRKPWRDRERPRGWSMPDQPVMAAVSGLAKANIIATPTPIRNAASIRPASRNMRPCSIGTSSGWRAADSRKFEPMMPIPTAAPMAPRPTMMPMPRAV